MPSDEFHRWSRKAAEWAARYLDEVETFPVLSKVSPGEIQAALPERAPRTGDTMEDIFRDLDQVIMPGVTHWNHPSFHGYFAVTGSGPGIIGELLSSTLNINAMVWKASPAGTELEAQVLDWVRELLGLPDGLFGVIHDTASTSSLVALAAARYRAYPDLRESGLFGLPRGRIYISAEAHSSIEKAALTLGFGRSDVIRVPTDEKFRMRPDELRRVLTADMAAGVRPVAVVATLGTTTTTSVDPIREIADIVDDADTWLHVDAAYAGAAAVLPEFRPLFDGWERADSIVFNPHKWLFTPVDCSILYSRRPDVIRDAFTLTPEYLRTEEGDGAVNLMDYGVALGRRFRALKLWFVLRYFGSDGIRVRIRNHIELARRFAGWVEADPDWEMRAPLPFATVVFRWAPAALTTAGPEGAGEERLDELNLELMHAVNRSGEVFLSHGRVAGRIVLRLSVGNLRTRIEHLENSWKVLRETAGRLLKKYRDHRWESQGADS